jgi:hypothetical protein
VVVADKIVVLGFHFLLFYLLAKLARLTSFLLLLRLALLYRLFQLQVFGLQMLNLILVRIIYFVLDSLLKVTGTQLRYFKLLLQLLVP